MVTSDGIQQGTPDPIDFRYYEMHLSASNIAKLISRQQIDIIIDYMELKHWYLFPTYLIAKGIMRRKMIYWGQGRDLLDADSRIKNLAYAAEQFMCDAVILYAESLKKYLPPRFHKKVFFANNTLYLNYKGLSADTTREQVFAGYGISTKKNIICMGRMQKRKRVDRLFEAFLYMKRPDVGLIFVGPDPEGVLTDIKGENVFKLGPIYGDKRFDLLSAADVYCLPGAVGLSIIDAFYCGLPFVTEDGDPSAEIAYLKDSVNGFIVPPDNIPVMAEKLLFLLDNEGIRQKFSDAARKEVAENASIDRMCAGFRDALLYVTHQNRAGQY
jgi:glycosyltransferase involved in cell wall biosynthesis